MDAGFFVKHNFLLILELIGYTFPHANPTVFE